MTLSNVVRAILIIVPVTLGLTVHGHRTDASTIGLYTNPYLLSLMDLNLGVDFRIADAVSAGPYAAYGDSKSDQGRSRYIGYGARVDLALNGKTFTPGWYISPFASRYKFTFTSDSSEGSEYRYGRSDFGATNVGSTVGYLFCSTDRDVNFFVRVGLGAMHTSFDGTTSLERKDGTQEENSLSEIKGFLPTGDIHVGIIF